MRISHCSPPNKQGCTWLLPSLVTGALRDQVVDGSSWPTEEKGLAQREGDSLGFYLRPMWGRSHYPEVKSGSAPSLLALTVPVSPCVQGLYPRKKPSDRTLTPHLPGTSALLEAQRRDVTFLRPNKAQWDSAEPTSRELFTLTGIQEMSWLWWAEARQGPVPCSPHLLSVRM